MNLADLHTHTNFSDGELSPLEILNEAMKNKIRYLSITDHDTLSGYKKAQKIVDNTLKDKIILIPGVEISTAFEGSNIHLLGYFFDVEDLKLNHILKQLQQRRNEFAKYVISNLNEEGFNINWGDLLVNVNGSLGRLHIAYAMQKKGIVKKVSDAFDLYLNRFKKDYKEHYEFNTAEIISLIDLAGGVSSIAHPHTVKNAEKIIPKLVEKGLIGIEVIENKKIYKNDKEFIEMGLLKTSGSDFHRKGRNSYLGKNNLSEVEFINFYNNSKKILNGKIKWKF